MAASAPAITLAAAAARTERIRLSSAVIRLTGSRSGLVHKELPSDDPLQRQPDITRAQAILKWEPKIGLEDGLVKTISYFRDLQNSQAARA